MKGSNIYYGHRMLCDFINTVNLFIVTAVSFMLTIHKHTKEKTNEITVIVNYFSHQIFQHGKRD